MALEDRGLQAEQFAELPCGTENLSPYSNPAGYVDPPSYYQTEFDWQQHPQQSQHPGLQHQQQFIESERHYYTGYPGDGSEANTHSYVGYGTQPVAHTDFYPQSHGLWPAGSPTTPLATGQINQQHRFFSGIDLSQQAMAQQSGSPNGSNGKPKRRRVQTHSQRKAANVRERRRMFHLNEAFDELRKRLPAFNYEKRLSRIETLRLAMTYISFMKEVSVGRDPKCVKLKPHGSELSLLPHDGSNILMSHQSYSGSDNNDDSNMMNDDSDCSNDELSNHSGCN